VCRRRWKKDENRSPRYFHQSRCCFYRTVIFGKSGTTNDDDSLDSRSYLRRSGTTAIPDLFDYIMGSDEVSFGVFWTSELGPVY